MRIKALTVLGLMERLPIIEISQFVKRGLLIIAPHPDDESLGCGGLIAAARAHNIPVEIIVVSDGVGSHPNSRSYPPPRLRSVREQEAVVAAAELGVSDASVKFLRMSDKSVPSTGPQAERAISEIAEIGLSCGADVMAVTWQHDPHCDHQAAFALAVAARRFMPGVRLYTYPIWGFRLPVDCAVETEIPQGFRLMIDEYLPIKRRAIAAHRSQVTRMIDDDPEGFSLDSAMLAYFDRPYETFLSVAG
jgi:LmbE family N-acetylglucosaminyl deacetylase